MEITKLLLFSALLADVALCQNDLPNIVIFIADDLDSELGGDAPLEKAHGWINDNGVTFTNAFVAVPVCCPSRATMLTGLYQHNHGVLNNTVEGDCCGDNWRADTELRTYAAYLKGAGYVSFYGGKYMNGYGLEAGGGLEHVPRGWDDWVALKGNSV